MKTVAVDFDGVIHSYERGWADGTIYGDFKPGAVTSLLCLLDHNAVFIHTARKPGQVARWIERKSGYVLETTTWFAPWRKFWDTPGLLLVTNRKLPAMAYVDDRAVRFLDWNQTMAELDGVLT